MFFKDDIRHLADLKLQISQKMILLCSTLPKYHCALVINRRCKLLSFFTIIFAVFLHNLASACQISSTRNHSRQSYDVISISKILKIVAMELEIHPGFGFIESTRLAMSKSISTLNFEKIPQSTAVLLLLLNRENGHPPDWHYTDGFDLTYWQSLAFGINEPNLKFLAPAHLPTRPPLTYFCIFFVSAPGDQYAW